MNTKAILAAVRANIDVVIAQNSPQGTLLLQELIEIHPADIADFIADIGRENAAKLFTLLPSTMRADVFEELHSPTRVALLEHLAEEQQKELLESLPLDEITDLLEDAPDNLLQHYLRMIHTKDRKKIISLMKFSPESAGGIMTTDIFTLLDDLTVERSINLLQRIRPLREIHQQLYLVNRSNQLVGMIHLEDLVLHKPHERITRFMQSPELIAYVDEDQEAIANKMVHYSVMTVPVVDRDNVFLGVISSDTLVDVIVEEASEDVQRMAALAPLKYPYFEMSFYRLLYERCSILVVLLLLGSISSGILHLYEATLGGLLLALVPMLTSTGGNASNQTSAMVIQGIASGDIHSGNLFRFWRREFLMACIMGILLGGASYLRVMITGGGLKESVAVSIAVSMIVVASVILGSSVPIVLRWFKIDPAFSAGPFLATAMDILGVMIYCTIVKLVWHFF